MRQAAIVMTAVGVVAGVLGACGGGHDLDTSTPTTRHDRFPAAVVSTTTPSTTPFGVVVKAVATTTTQASTNTTRATPRVATTTTSTPGRVMPAASPLPVARAGVAGAAWHGFVVVAGGAGSGGGFSSRVDVYDPKSGQWTRGANLPVGLRDAALAVLGDDLWIVGGTAVEDDQPVAQSKTYFFHAGNDAWQEGPTLHTPRAGVAVTVLGNYLVALGGEQTDGTILDTVEALANGGKDWKDVQSMSIPRAFAAALTMNGRIYAVGGRTPGAPAVNSVESWRSGSGGWRNESRLDTERVHLSGAGSCVGGGQNSSGVVTTVECFGTGFWVTQGQMRVPRYGLAAAVIDGWLHLIGGGTAGQAVTNTHEVIDVSSVPTS